MMRYDNAPDDADNSGRSVADNIKRDQAKSKFGQLVKTRWQAWLLIIVVAAIVILPQFLLFIVYVGGQAGYGSGVSNDPLQSTLDLMQ